MRPLPRIALGLLLLAVALSARAAEPSEDLFPTLNAQDLLNDNRAAWGAVPIFFPPEPPPLEGMVEMLERSRWETYGRLRAPQELAAFVGEPFYPALSTLLAMQDLGRWSRNRVEEYRDTKSKLQAELRAELLRLRDAPVDVRQARLTVFAREQTPKIAALEREAEDLRGDLTKVDYRWGALRREYLGQDDYHPESADEVADVMRATAYYQGGLLPAQRRFLREIALELPLAAHTMAESVAAQPEAFFSPGLARVRWPQDLPVDLARKIADYQTRRNALKKRLYDVVFKADRTWLSIVRSVQLHFSLGPQAVAFDQLEELAEDIRRGLAQLPAPAQRAASPPALTQRIGVMLERQRALCRGSVDAIEAIRRRETSLDITYGLETTGLRFSVLPRSRFLFGKTAEAKRRAQAVQLEIAAIAAAHQHGLAALEQERAAIRAALARTLLLEDPRDIAAAVAAATREAFEQESDGPFRAYHNAVFEPGLSPEQRRLLFDSAVQQLLLPLPPGEYQPQ